MPGRRAAERDHGACCMDCCDPHAKPNGAAARYETLASTYVQPNSWVFPGKMSKKLILLSGVTLPHSSCLECGWWCELGGEPEGGGWWPDEIRGAYCVLLCLYCAPVLAHLRACLQGATCEGSTIAAGNRLLFSTPFHPTSRANMTVFTSSDAGLTWNSFKHIDTGPSGYVCTSQNSSLFDRCIDF